MILLDGYELTGNEEWVFSKSIETYIYVLQGKFANLANDIPSREHLCGNHLKKVRGAFRDAQNEIYGNKEMTGIMSGIFSIPMIRSIYLYALKIENFDMQQKITKIAKDHDVEEEQVFSSQLMINENYLNKDQLKTVISALECYTAFKQEQFSYLGFTFWSNLTGSGVIDENKLNKIKLLLEKSQIDAHGSTATCLDVRNWQIRYTGFYSYRLLLLLNGEKEKADMLLDTNPFALEFQNKMIGSK